MKESTLVLAEHPGLGRVHLCECSSVHLSVGPVTLNLEPAAFLQLTALMSKAAEKLAHQKEEPKTPEMLFDMLERSQSTITH